MKTKFTKGKWELFTDSKNAFGVDYSCVGTKELGVFIDIYSEEREANALLISKAPEMFEMLEKAERTLREVYDCDTTELKQLLKEATEL